MKPANFDINLLPKDPFLASPIGRLMQWALSFGRYLVIFTELIVVISFATRFNLDRKVTDLNGAIHQKQVIIESFGDLEQNVLTAQKKIAAYQQVEQRFNLADAFPPLSAVMPQDVQLDQLTIAQSTILFSGSTLSDQSLHLLINNMQLSPDFSGVSVDSIQTAQDKPGYRFQIRANVVRKTS